MKASVVVPAHNEEPTLGTLLDDLKRVCGSKHEIIVVDDGSTDNTPKIAEKAGVILIKNKKNLGKGGALRKGFERASGDIIVMMDADLSHTPDDISQMLEPFSNSEVGLVIASRTYGGSDEYTHTRAVGNRLLTWFLNFMFGMRLSDALNGFKAFRKDVTSDLDCSGFNIEIELIADALRRGYKIVEVSSHEAARAGGNAKLRPIKDGWSFAKQTIIESFGLRFRKKK